MRDITLEETLYFNFTTRAFSSGVPTVLAGTPVLSVLESNNATPITAGVSVSVDRASVVGLNQATVVATAANGYEAAKSYAVYISTGTVGGVSVIGEVVAEFTVQAGAAYTKLPAAPASTTNITAATGITLSATTGLGAQNGPVATVTTLTNLPAITANWLTAAGTDAGFGAELATAIWTDTTAGDFTVALSVGKSVMNGVSLGTGLTVARCTLTDTLTTYTGNTVQTGDSFARIGALGAGLTGITGATLAAVTGLGAQTANITGTITTATNVTTVNGLAANVITAASMNADASVEIAAAVWDEDATAHQTAGTFGKAIGDPLAATNSLIQRTPDAAAGATNGLFIAGTNAATTVTTALTANITGNLSGSVGSVATGGIAAASFAAGAIDAAAIAPDAGTEIATAVWASAARTLTAATNFNNISTGDVLTQVNAAIDTAISELGVAAPTATPTIRTGLMLLYMALRNKLVVQTSGTDALELYNDAGTKIASKLLTDSGGDYTEAEMS